jgi:hypothetical protein
MFENKYAKLPDEPPMTNMDVDTVSSATAARNNGPVPASARKRSRISSKNHSNQMKEDRVMKVQAMICKLMMKILYDNYVFSKIK